MYEPHKPKTQRISQENIQNNFTPAKCNVHSLDEVRRRRIEANKKTFDALIDDGIFDPELVELPPAALEELQSIDQWVAWRYLMRPGATKPTKPPVDPHTGRGASHSDPATWASYEEACLRKEKSNLAGVGFVLTDDDEFVGVDVDRCIDKESGEVAPWAAEIVNTAETYCEVSPSGTGIRMIARGELLKAIKSDLAGIEIYFNKRYLTITGNHIEGTPDSIRPAPQTLAALLARCEAMRPKDDPESKPVCAKTSHAESRPDDAGARAWARAALEGKAAELAATGDGGRNHALNASAYGMGRMVARGWIEQGEVIAALTDACRQNGLYKEDGARGVRATLMSGLKSGLQSPHEDLPENSEGRDEIAIAEARGNMLVEADDEADNDDTGEAEQEANAAPTAPDFADAILERQGLVSEIARWILRASRRPQKRFAVASALAVVATAASRHVQTPTFSNVNLFLTIIGESGSGKEVPMKAALELLTQSDLGREMVGPDGFQSDTAVYDKVRQQPSCLAAINEFGDYLAKATARNAPAHLSKVLAVLRKLYDGGIVPTPHSCARPSEPLRNPCLTIFGASTHGQFYYALTDAQAEDGTINRFIAITAPLVAKKRGAIASHEDVPENLRKLLIELADRPGGVTACRFRIPLQADNPLLERPFIVPWTDEAHQLWDSYEDEIDMRKVANPDIGRFAARCPLNALRVATVLAVGENIEEPRLDAVHIEIGKQIVEVSLRDMMRGFDEHGEETPESRLANRIKRLLASKGGSIRRNQLVRSLQRHIRNVKALNDALNVLIEAREIAVDPPAPSEKGRGRPSQNYRLR